MRFYFFASTDVQRSSSIKDNFSGIYTNYVRKIDTLSNYNIIILMGVITLLLVLYSFIAYSFLKSSSALLLKNNNHAKIHIENSTAHNYSIDSHIYTFTHKNNICSTTHTSKNSVVSTIHSSFQKYVKPIQQDYTLLQISKSRVGIDSNKSLQNNKTILS
ncbi:hypothetical protein ATE84_3925 [Aquimarina sp. MAR_2010_214]|uniref:hypothetical protein n=1 Tax=Aquimarina sp. MAR_2010_214 TaxID=1250026 RepID=UPI000C700C11|nr:hypothetical protein [Aquimarina sp. MAR_2010_214]PKV51825.1 hypothetical protein ATE84_3925 [Aquimarina sp. MAR_2010_214]